MDPDQLFSDAEGMTTFDDLVKETLKFDCLPAVVPELKTITIGGALVGIGIESSSFRYGLVHETISEFDLLLATGQVIHCTATNEHQDLFRALPNSYGTLGYALKIRAKLVRVKPFVKLIHYKFKQPDKYYQTLKTLCETNHSSRKIDFIDGSIFSPNNMAITTAEGVDNPPNLANYTYMEKYYQSIQDRTEDCLSIADYIWRWDTDWFWCSKAFGLNYSIVRWLFGQKRLNSNTYTKIMRLFWRNKVTKAVLNLLTKSKESIIQDVMIPIEKAPDFFDFFHKEIGILPVWNCPVISYAPDANYSFFNYTTNNLYVNFGFWDNLPIKNNPSYYNRLIEQTVTQMKGFKSLYSSSFYSHGQFWSLYNEDLYTQLKTKYDPNYLLGDLYCKCTNQDSN